MESFLDLWKCNHNSFSRTHFLNCYCFRFTSFLMRAHYHTMPSFLKLLTAALSTYHHLQSCNELNSFTTIKVEKKKVAKLWYIAGQKLLSGVGSFNLPKSAIHFIYSRVSNNRTASDSILPIQAYNINLNTQDLNEMTPFDFPYRVQNW